MVHRRKTKQQLQQKLPKSKKRRPLDSACVDFSTALRIAEKTEGKISHENMQITQEHKERKAWVYGINNHVDRLDHDVVQATGNAKVSGRVSAT